MRIIAGTLKGRNFDSPKGHRTHPMSDKMRGALFNVLGDVANLRMLDAFAGSGALSFEAASRGAASVIAIDSDKAAQQAITTTIRQFELANVVKLIKATANAWLSTNETAEFDIVLCDPPYDDTQLMLIDKLAQRVSPHGLLVLSWPGHAHLPEVSDFRLVVSKNYGDGQLGFYRR